MFNCDDVENIYSAINKKEKVVIEKDIVPTLEELSVLSTRLANTLDLLTNKNNSHLDKINKIKDDLIYRGAKPNKTLIAACIALSRETVSKELNHRRLK